MLINTVEIVYSSSRLDMSPLPAFPPPLLITCWWSQRQSNIVGFCYSSTPISRYCFYFRYISVIVHTHTSKTRGLIHQQYFFLTIVQVNNLGWTQLDVSPVVSTGRTHVAGHSVEVGWTHSPLIG